MGTFRDVELEDLELDGERVVLRRWRAEDADRVREIMADASMGEFLALPDPYTAEDATRFVTDIGHEGRDVGTGVGCAVVRRGSDEVVGAAALRLGEDPDIGYWVAPDARGNGYATEATRLLADLAFELGRPRVRLDCDVRNLASARSALRAGFAFEGISRSAVTSGGGGGAATRHGDLAHFARLADDPGRAVPPVFADLPPGGLSDGVVTLRVLAPGDAEAFAETDDQLTLRNGFGGPAHAAPEYRRVTAQAGLDCLVGARAVLAVVDAASGRFAGSLTVRLAGPPQIGGIGYVVHPDFRGRGYAARALRLVAPWAFDTAGFARLELGAKVSNLASCRAAEAAGFTHDGVFRGRLRGPDGTFHDEARYSLLNPRCGG